MSCCQCQAAEALEYVRFFEAGDPKCKVRQGVLRLSGLY